MPQKNSTKIEGGQYVCRQCDETFNSIMELRVHEKLCRNTREQRLELEEGVSAAPVPGKN